MRLGPHADELASQDTSFVRFEAQKKALEISAALRDLRQVDIRSLGCRWKHGFQRIFNQRHLEMLEMGRFSMFNIQLRILLGGTSKADGTRS